MDNDNAAETATNELRRDILVQEDIIFGTKNHLYAQHKDVSEWHMNK